MELEAEVFHPQNTYDIESSSIIVSTLPVYLTLL